MLVQYTHDKEAEPPHTVSVYVDSEFIDSYEAAIQERDQNFGRALLRAFLEMNKGIGNHPLDRVLAPITNLDDDTECVLDSSNLGFDLVSSLSRPKISHIPDPDTDSFRLTMYELDDDALTVEATARDAFITDSANEVNEIMRTLAYDHLLLARQICSFVVEPPSLV